LSKRRDGVSLKVQNKVHKKSKRELTSVKRRPLSMIETGKGEKHKVEVCLSSEIKSLFVLSVTNHHALERAKRAAFNFGFCFFITGQAKTPFLCMSKTPQSSPSFSKPSYPTTLPTPAKASPSALTHLRRNRRTRREITPLIRTREANSPPTNGAERLSD